MSRTRVAVAGLFAVLLSSAFWVTGSKAQEGTVKKVAEWVVQNDPDEAFSRDYCGAAKGASDE